MKHQVWRVGALFLLGLVFLGGCGSTGKQRTPQEWLSLSYSGLAATDQYAFTGSMSMKTEGGLSFEPEIFEGRVVDHQQLTLQTSSTDPLHWNPVQVLEALNESSEEVYIVEDNKDADTIKLMLKEAASLSNERWKQRLLQQLDQLGANMPAAESPYFHEWTKELNSSRKQLEAILTTLEAETEYELVIDRDRLLPLEMKEETVFRYRKADKPFSETRKTTVRFQSFDGNSSDAVQHKLNRK
ncbi:hypothetical protein [Paenibacillus sinopodophylli]|uniref:hypothetical protein n=1 Tax=Paenibacillus sinopodophylli TaxID=1837342 RepID=UPI00110D01D0|nr:hypothetical protein [Paenibacillus sinopodophylli]